MSAGARFRGLPVSAGRAAGTLVVIADGDNSKKRGSAQPRPFVTADDVTAAFAAVSRQRSELAARLRADGRAEEAGIIEVAALIAADPALTNPAADAVRGGADPAAAVRESAECQARAMEQLSNPDLAARAEDIRQVGAAVVSYLQASAADSPVSVVPASGEPFILVRREVSPAELIELADEGIAGAVSVAGGASSHAAIIARGLGLPMIAGADPAVLDAAAGVSAVLDADADVGELVVGEPSSREETSHGRRRVTGDVTETMSSAAGPARTADGTEITVLCNVASAPEARRGLAAGAQGVGLLRTEIPFLDADGWPPAEAQRARLAPILDLLGGLTATVRLLDFSGDKIPPFFGGPVATLRAGAGLAALLDHPSALRDQLRAICAAGRDAKLAVLIPMVSSPAEIDRVRGALRAAAADAGIPVPPVGIMVELAATARHAADFASADFFSIGTNDLAGDVLALSRRDPAAGPALTADPRVLELVRQVADTGREAGIGVSVCGDAAADPHVLPLLIGVGIRTVSVPAARVAAVRSGLAELDARACADLAGRVSATGR
ncbi:MAG TPA: putative PEP-binding protein [Trebonia sp.]|nr:putative PEP-binding protein [Trebonia sp.]